MVAHSERERDAGRDDSGSVPRGGGRDRRSEVARRTDSSQRLLPDGGQAQADEDGDEASEAETAEGESEAADDVDEADDVDQEPEGETDEEDEAEDAPDDAPGDEETGDEEAEDEETGDEESGDEETGDEEADQETGEDEETGEHGGDAEDVYESDEASGVLHLDLDGLFLDLLGLEVNLNDVTLDVSARPGENNLLGNLLSAVTGLGDSITSPLDGLTDALGGLKDRLVGMIPGLGGGDGDPEGDDDDEDASEGATLASIGDWFRDRLRGLASALPLEEIVTMIVRETIEQIVDRAESAAGDLEAEPGDEGDEAEPEGGAEADQESEAETAEAES